MMPRQSMTRSPSARYVHTLHLQAGRSRPALDLDERDLHDQIAELEERVRTAPERERQRRVSQRDLVPPADRQVVSRRSGNGGLRTRQEQQCIDRERRGHIVISLLLVTMLIGLLNWLAHLLRA